MKRVRKAVSVVKRRATKAAVVGEVVRAAIAAIEDKGRLTPEAVLSAAAEPSSPLHAHFEWDDTKAAYQHRLEQARELIRSVKVVVTINDRVISTVHYVRDPRAEREDQGYVSIAQLRSEPENARAMVLMEFSRAASSLHRAEDLAAVFGMRADVSALARKVEATGKKIERQRRRKKVA